VDDPVAEARAIPCREQARDLLIHAIVVAVRPFDHDHAEGRRLSAMARRSQTTVVQLVAVVPRGEVAGAVGSYKLIITTAQTALVEQSDAGVRQCLGSSID